MRLLHHRHFFRFPDLLHKTPTGSRVYRYKSFRSKSLHRKVVVDLYLPPSFNMFPRQYYPTLFFNDGQDMEGLQLLKTLDRMYGKKLMGEIIVVAVHAHNRLQEYGIASQPDYKNHGSKAQAYTDFIIYELMPFVRFKYRSVDNPSHISFAGCSLGGLFALDIAWSHPELFSRVGIFSGSFWWRTKAYEAGYQDTDRIMHRIIREGTQKPGMKFWFQAGTLDETADRNNSGTIDAIEDTLDLVNELNNKGYRNGADIVYRQVEGGKHDLSTWAAVLPEFLLWAYGTNKVRG